MSSVKRNSFHFEQASSEDQVQLAEGVEHPAEDVDRLGLELVGFRIPDPQSFHAAAPSREVESRNEITLK